MDVGQGAMNHPLSQQRPTRQVALYRPDVDGLRAVAVLSVVLFHIGFAALRGGYVGVDVFFVISGYLIGGIVHRELTERRFSVVGFYARRIGRILPAFAVLVAATSVFALVFLFPTELRSYAWSVIAAALSVSNIYFFSLAGYFDQESSSQLLLHTWSLGVEEQFYFFLPAYLLLSSKLDRPKLQFAGLVAICLLSFGYNIATVGPDPQGAFYLPLSRMWELLLGTLLAMGQGWLPAANRWVRECLCLAGLVMVLAAATRFTPTTTFPGWAAALPCIGSALLLWAGQGGPTWTTSALSTAPMRFFGLISYSLYLWHWPVIVLQRRYELLLPQNTAWLPSHPALPANIAIFVVSVVLAVLSWALIERPWRRRARTTMPGRVVRLGLLPLAGLTAVGLLLAFGDGFLPRFSPEAVRLADYMSYGQQHLRPHQCFIVQGTLPNAFDSATCLHMTPNKPAYLLLGDSHAADLWYGLSHVATGADILQATAAGCPPTLEQPANARSACSDLMREMFQGFIPQHPDVSVILAGRWYPTDAPALAETVKSLRAEGRRVLVVGTRPEFTSALPRLLAMATQKNLPDLPSQHALDQSGTDILIKDATEANGGTYVSLSALLCPNGTCRLLLDGGVPLEFDDDHFTRDGSILAARGLVGTGFFH